MNETYAEVFPTRVGMFRVNPSTLSASVGFPHPRGDVPALGSQRV